MGPDGKGCGEVVATRLINEGSSVRNFEDKEVRNTLSFSLLSFLFSVANVSFGLLTNRIVHILVQHLID